MAHQNCGQEPSSTVSLMPGYSRNETNLSKKLSRNVCEKIRRDKLNFLIQELAKEVPIIASCQKKLDKSSILRLTVAYLKIHFGIKKMKMAQGSWKPDTLSTNNWGQLLQDAVDGFLIVVSKKGTIILLTEAIGHILGHNQFDFIGKDIETIIHPDDVKLFHAQFLPRHYSGTSPDSGSSTRSFYTRFLNVNYRENACYTMIHIVGQLQEMSLLSREANTAGTSNDVWLNGVGRVLENEVIQNISILDGGRNEWITQHAMDGQILYTDPRSCHVTGSMPSENYGTSVYMHINPEDIYFVGKSHKKILSEGEVPSTIFRLQTLGSDEQTFVESRSCVARDSWTHQPKFIVSLNTQLSVEEGTKKLDKQRKEDTDEEITNTEELMSEIIKAANSLAANSPELMDQPYGFTSHGDVIKAVDNSDPLSDKNSSVDDGYSNHRKRRLDETPNGNLHQKDACISGLDSYPDLNGIELSMIGSSSNHGSGSSEEFMDTTGLADDDDRKEYPSSNESSNEGATTPHETQKDSRQETSILSDILHGKGSLHHPQNSFHSYPNLPHQDSSNPEISRTPHSVSSGLPHYSNCSSPSSSAGSQNFDEFTVFADQLQRKHLEIGESLNFQLEEISRIEDIIAHSLHHKDTAQHQKLQGKLALIKGQQSQMESELLKLKKDVSMTVQHLPHNNEDILSSGGSPPGYSSLPPAQVPSGTDLTFNSGNNYEYMSNDPLHTGRDRHNSGHEAFGNHYRNDHSQVNSHPQGSDFNGYDVGSNAPFVRNHHATSRGSCTTNVQNGHAQNFQPYGSNSDGRTSVTNPRDSVKFVCDGYKNLSSVDRISRIKTALGRIPVPKMFYPPANYSPENIV
ncbi:hypothetical protein LOTGIDRAFT_237855 [Lottia gigantea]|uniref:Uncharacterized protein n=1 Tax=Lottia gigantea TaxID=225164 RepID=V4AFC0_LOTGI|nr:hypothetical protein LOTGIDRAFT_237855 [Lottia gigantea]ESP02724.1 hypothetical protein LOTGIDRAFT_237855 [Lottia gigantea]